MSARIRIDGSEVEFTAEPAQSVLDAALAAGVELPYSCRKGVCGNCLARVLDGPVSGGVGQGCEGADAGELLLCRAHALGDLLIAPRSWRRAEPGARVVLDAQVLSNKLAADDVSLLQLRFAAGVRARFAAGQYLEVLLPDGGRRAFSMANAPQDNDGVLLHVRHVPGGAFTSRVVPGLQRGDTLRVELAHGDFRLREQVSRPLLFVAGGTGFAPIKSIIDDMLRRGVERDITLYWGARDPRGLYGLDTIARWQRKRPRLKFIPVISDPGAQPPWSGRRGLVHEALRQDIASPAAFDVYACGAPAMVRAVRTELLARGLPAEQFFSDSFVSGADDAGA